MKHTETVKHTPRKFIIEYDNDTGPDDEGFWEWWTVTDGERAYKCDVEADAKYLALRLNCYDELVKALQAYVLYYSDDASPVYWPKDADKPQGTIMELAEAALAEVNKGIEE